VSISPPEGDITDAQEHKKIMNNKKILRIE
jgi:hypothetical protein